MANHIKSLREQSGMTQAQLARAIGVSRGTISQYECDAARPNQQRRFQLASVLGADIEALGFDSTAPAQSHISIWSPKDVELFLQVSERLIKNCDHLDLSDLERLSDEAQRMIDAFAAIAEDRIARYNELLKKRQPQIF